jgi:hypothetical protein
MKVRRAPRTGDQLGALQGRGGKRPARIRVTVAELTGPRPGCAARQHRPARAPSPFAFGAVARRIRNLPGRRRAALLGGVAAVVVAGLAALGLLLGRPPGGGPGVDGVLTGQAQAKQWLAAYGDGAVFTDDGFRAWLLRAGWDPARVTTPASCTPDACPPGWLVVTPALRSELSRDGALAAAVTGSTPVAVFGSADGRVEIRHPGLRAADQDAGELRARATVGRALDGLPRIDTGQSVRTLLDAGRVDPRVLAALAGLSGRGPVRVLDLPAVPGEDAAGQPRRQLLLGVPPAGTEALMSFFAKQRGPYQPAAAGPTANGLLVRYPPLAPPGLLRALAGP